MPNFQNRVVETANIFVDETHYPFLYTQIHDSPRKADFVPLADYFHTVLSKGEPTVLLADLRPVEHLKLIETTRFWVPWATKHKKLIDTNAVASAFLSNNKIVVKVIHAVLKLLPLASPLDVFSTAPEAIAWIYQQAERQGLALPDQSTWSDL